MASVCFESFERRPCVFRSCAHLANNVGKGCQQIHTYVFTYTASVQGIEII